MSFLITEDLMPGMPLMSAVRQTLRIGVVFSCPWLSQNSWNQTEQMAQQVTVFAVKVELSEFDPQNPFLNTIDNQFVRVEDLFWLLVSNFSVNGWLPVAFVPVTRPYFRMGDCGRESCSSHSHEEAKRKRGKGRAKCQYPPQEHAVHHLSSSKLRLQKVPATHSSTIWLKAESSVDRPLGNIHDPNYRKD